MSALSDSLQHALKILERAFRSHAKTGLCLRSTGSALSPLGTLLSSLGAFLNPLGRFSASLGCLGYHFVWFGAPGPRKTMFFQSKTVVFEVSTKPLLEIFCALFGRRGPPFACPKAAIRLPKGIQSPPQTPKSSLWSSF